MLTTGVRVKCRPDSWKSASLAVALARRPKFPDQLCKLIVFGVEVGQRQSKYFCQTLHDLQIGLMNACLVAVDACAGDEIVQARLDSEIPLRNAVGLAGFS